MKSNLFFIAIIIIIGGYLIYQAPTEDAREDTAVVSDAEREFNASGRAKAIADETDLWQFYEDAGAGFSIRYPHNVSLGAWEEGKSFRLTITSEAIAGLEGTMGFNEETALKNMEFLAKGEYGQAVDFPLTESKKVRKIDGRNAQEFMVLARFEVCDVAFERKLYFFKNNHQVVITLAGARDELRASASEYFATNQANCGEEKIWNFEKQKLFFADLEKGVGADAVQEWYNLFEKIAGTISFNETGASGLELLQGKWVSIADEKSVVEFKAGKKIDIYNNEKMLENNFGLYNDRDVNKIGASDQNGKYLIVGVGADKMEYEIAVITDNLLTLIYLDRGNLLEYKKQ